MLSDSFRLLAWPLQDDDSYGEDEFDRSEGEGGGGNSPGRERGGRGGQKNAAGGRVPCEASEWPMSKRIKGLKTLKRLSKANRYVQCFRSTHPPLTHRPTHAHPDPHAQHITAFQRCFSRDADTSLFTQCREAGELRQLLAEGIAPEPPKFWSAKPDHPDVGQEHDALTDELLLCWRPQHGSTVRVPVENGGLL